MSVASGPGLLEAILQQAPVGYSRYLVVMCELASICEMPVRARQSFGAETPARRGTHGVVDVRVAVDCAPDRAHAWPPLPVEAVPNGLGCHAALPARACEALLEADRLSSPYSISSHHVLGTDPTVAPATQNFCALPYLCRWRIARNRRMGRTCCKRVVLGALAYRPSVPSAVACSHIFNWRSSVSEIWPISPRRLHRCLAGRDK